MVFFIEDDVDACAASGRPATPRRAAAPTAEAMKARRDIAVFIIISPFHIVPRIVLPSLSKRATPSSVFLYSPCTAFSGEEGMSPKKSSTVM